MSNKFKGTLIIGSAGAGRQFGFGIDENRLGYLISYDIIVLFHTLSIEQQWNVTNFFSSHKHHEVLMIYRFWLNEFINNNNENPFLLDEDKNPTRMGTKFCKFIMDKVSSYKLRTSFQVLEEHYKKQSELARQRI